MMIDYNMYWERCWKEEEPEQLYKYLDSYYGITSKELDVFKEYNVGSVCDAACGFGAYSLAFATNGFDVYSFDISDTAVEITKNGLKKYGIESNNVKVAGILDTGYTDAFFDGVIADYLVQTKINDAKIQVRDAIQSVSNVLAQLKAKTV